MQLALIPVKELSLAKARLAPVLDEERRKQLVLALYRDVLAAALACEVLDGVAVVTRDEELLTIAREAGAQAMAEPGDLNESLTSAAAAMSARGADRVLVLAADLPLVRPEDIEAVFAAEADVALVASGDGGTNALSVPTKRAIAFQFGPGSAKRHVEAGNKAKLRTLQLDLPRLALDIDTPDDLIRLRLAGENSNGVGANTLTALERIGIVRAALRDG